MSLKRAIPFRQFFMSDMNPVIRFLILSDVVWEGARGLLGPIFALFIVDFIEGQKPPQESAAAISPMSPIRPIPISSSDQCLYKNSSKFLPSRLRCWPCTEPQSLPYQRRDPKAYIRAPCHMAHLYR